MPFRKEDLDKQVIDALEEAKRMTRGGGTIPLIERMKIIKAQQEKRGK